MVNGRKQQDEMALAEKDGADSAAGEDQLRAVKIWGVQVDYFGLIQDAFSQEKDLGRSFEGLSEIEVNMVKHRMFLNGEVGVPALAGKAMGVLYSVNFMPGNKEIPITIKWLDPSGSVVSAETVSTRYSRRQITTYTFHSSGKRSTGQWNVEFYYDEQKIAGQAVVVMEQERYETRLERWED